MISVTAKGDGFKKLRSRLARKKDFAAVLARHGQAGVAALSSATPVDSALTANSWYYEVKTENGKYTISWYNSHVESGVNIAVILQYGHGTGTGGYVHGRDYINPAIRPIFDKILADLRKEVTT